MSDFDFGGAYARTEGQLQQNDQSRQQFPLDMAHLRATTRASNAYADIAEHKVQADKKMQEIMSTLQLDPQASPSAQTMQLAGAAMKAGDGVTARELMTRSAQQQHYEAQATAALAKQKTEETKLHLQQANRYIQLMSGVKTKEDFDRANQLFQREFGEAPPAAEFDPKTVKILQESAVTARDRIVQEHDRNMEQLRRAQIGETAGYHRQAIELRKGELKLRQEREQRLGKEGGKDVGAPGKTEVDAAKDVIEREGKSKGLDATSARSAAFDLASRAKVLRRQNPGLSAGEAQQRALVEQVEEGYYATEKTGGIFGFGKTDKQTYRTGSSVESALPAPKDLKTLKTQKYYQTPRGVLLYLGGGKWQVPDTANQGTPPAGGDEEEDPEMDEEE